MTPIIESGRPLIQGLRHLCHRLRGRSAGAGNRACTIRCWPRLLRDSYLPFREFGRIDIVVMGMTVELTEPISSKTPTDSSTELPVLSIDPALQIRVAISQATVDEYAARMTAGDVFPPIVAFSVGDDLLLADGFHRYHAAKKAGLMALAVTVRQGTRRDAILHAITANSIHGLARSNADKRRSVVLALQEFADRSDRVIAAMCKTSQPFVSGIRRELKMVISSSKRVGRDGKYRSMPSRRARKVPTGEKVTLPISEPDAALAHGGQGNAEFHADDAWNRIERFLDAELTAWPTNMKPHAKDQLQKFIERNL